MRFGIKSTLKTFLLIAGISLVLLSYVPDIINNERLYDSLRIINYVLFGSLFLLAFNFKDLVSSRIISFYAIILYIFLAETLIFLYLNLDKEFSDFIELTLPFASIVIGYSLSYTQRKYKLILITFCLLALIPGVLSVFEYVGSFTIMDQYSTEHKNALGALLANYATIIICLAHMEDAGKFRKMRYILYFVLFCACILVLRARAAFLALMCVMILVLWLNIKLNKYRYLIITGLFTGIILLFLSRGFIIPAFLHDFFFGGKDITDLNAISSGRIERNIAAIRLIADYPLFGELSTSEHLRTVHNYILLKVSQLGLLGSLPIMLLYFFIAWTIIKNVFMIKQIGLENSGYIIMIIPLIISLFEPSYPFGPGSVQVIAFLMFGYSLKNTYLNSKV